MPTLKDLISEADDLAMDICELMGGNAEIEGTPERYEVVEFVWRLQKYDHTARNHCDWEATR